MLAISSVMSFTLELVLIERMMTAKGGVVVPIEQLRIVKKMLPDLPRGTCSEVAATRGGVHRWSFDGVFDASIRSPILGIEFQGFRPTATIRRRLHCTA